MEFSGEGVLQSLVLADPGAEQAAGDRDGQLQFSYSCSNLVLVALSNLNIRELIFFGEVSQFHAVESAPRLPLMPLHSGTMYMDFQKLRRNEADVWTSCSLV